MTEKQHPLILVFYLDRELMQNPEIVKQFADSINNIIGYKKMNAVAFFLPTDGEERLECINPIVVPKVEMDKIGKMVKDINKHFNIGDNLEDNKSTEE